MRKIITIISAVVLFQSGIYAQTPGDFCSSPISAIVGPNSFDTTNNKPTLPEPDESQCLNTYLNWNSSPDVWFKFVPANSGFHNFSTCDLTSFDTSMVLYESDCTLQVACNGDATPENGCQDFHSAIDYNLTAGVPYYIRIGGFDGITGAGTLTIDPQTNGGSTTWYVDISNTAPGSGTDWDSAFTYVQDALNIATGNDQIWIAEGTYTPTDTDNQKDPREASFRIHSSLEIYGGFQGNETSISQRDPYLYRVILSGDLYGDDDFGGMNENAYHVIQIDGNVAAEPILDSLFIVSGNADDAGANKYGAGIIVINSSVSSGLSAKISECTFISNNAENGGAIATYTSNDRLFLDRVIIRNNNAEQNGGAIYNNGSLLLSNSLIVGNTAGAAGAIYCASDSSTTITNATLVQNRADYIGGLVIRGSGVATNNIIWGNTDINGEHEQVANYLPTGWLNNYNCVQNIDSTFGGTGNISANPMFVAELGDDGEPGTGDETFDLLPRSPCIDSGDNDAVTQFLDLHGNYRIVDDPYVAGNGAVVDMGAYERDFNTDNIYIWTGSGDNSLLTDPNNWLPIGAPDINTSMFFNSTTNVSTVLDIQMNINDFIVTSGNISIDLGGYALYLESLGNPLRIGGADSVASLQFSGINSYVYTNTSIDLYKSNLSFTDDIYLYTPNLIVRDSSNLRFDGTMYSNLTNVGGVVETAGRSIGTFTVNGDLLNMAKLGLSGNLVGSLVFDIQGNAQHENYDFLNIVGQADMSCLIGLRWGPLFTPTEGDVFDIMGVSSSTGSPSIVYSDGLPSHLAVRWVNPSGLRVGEEVVVETTGAIMFGNGSSHDLSSSTAPTDMVVGEFNGDSYPDIAMTVQDNSGGNGSVVILINNGMSGDNWLGFTESAPISVGISPMDIEIGDLNVDGTANDLVIANNGSNTVSILSNDNSGIFTKTDVSTDIGPMYIAVGDYVEEAEPAPQRDDIFVVCSSFLGSILTNSSTFRTRAIVFSHTSSISIPLTSDVEPSDVNHDKDLDFIILDSASEEIRVLHGTGAGTTPAMVVTGNPLPSSSNPVELHFADFDLDGNSDAITVNEGNDTLSILLGSNTELGNASTFPVGTSPTSLVTYDFDNDGDVDIVVSAINKSTIIRELTLIRNDTPSPGGTVVLSAGDAAGTGDTPVSVEHGDFDGDGLEDLASLIDQGANGPGVGIYFNVTAVVVNCPEDIDGDGSIAVGDLLAIISAWGTSNPSADVNNDGVVDVSDLLAVVASWGPCP
ncbi:MAG TPA: hypothetical protein EYM90_00450 [Phycisphaerales bacterium]|nr:hypothetical protein [Phycisphaerales bacterium]